MRRRIVTKECHSLAIVGWADRSHSLGRMQKVAEVETGRKDRNIRRIEPGCKKPPEVYSWSKQVYTSLEAQVPLHMVLVE